MEEDDWRNLSTSDLASPDLSLLRNVMLFAFQDFLKPHVNVKLAEQSIPSWNLATFTSHK
jgi:hypothetical protein